MIYVVDVPSKSTDHKFGGINFQQNVKKTEWVETREDPAGKKWKTEGVSPSKGLLYIPVHPLRRQGSQFSEWPRVTNLFLASTLARKGTKKVTRTSKTLAAVPQSQGYANLELNARELLIRVDKSTSWQYGFLNFSASIRSTSQCGQK